MHFYVMENQEDVIFKFKKINFNNKVFKKSNSFIQTGIKKSLHLEELNVNPKNLNLLISV